MITKLTPQFKSFFSSEKSGGLLLIICTIVSLTLANSAYSAEYIGLWNFEIGHHNLTHWINDGLMTIFFLLIGLELEREIYKGELSSVKTALLPAFAATGGMLMPSLIHFLLNQSTPYQSGAAIPMATDIAFSIGVLSILGKRVPASLKVFLTALAVIDDLGAIIIIAVVYTDTISISYLSFAIAIFALLLVFNRLKIHMLFPYLAGGFAMWYCMVNSGVHATISGVMLAFALPFGDGGKKTISSKIQNVLHLPVAFIIIPLFALANTCFIIESDWSTGLLGLNSIGIMAGLIVGKPLGIILFTFIAIVAKVCSMPEDINWSHVLGAGFLGGIGFTMSIFITLLAFDNSLMVNESKIAILIASACSAILGFLWLFLISKPFKIKQNA